MSGEGPLRVAVLASGNGSNLQALIDGPHERGTIELVGVASDKPGATALERAGRAGVATSVFPRDDYADRTARDLAIAAWLEGLGVELVVLAGYMQLLSGEFIRSFSNRIVNVHPALLPSFAGLDAVGQAVAHGVRVTGVTVHFVDEGVDTGPILLQEAVELTYTRPMEAVMDEIHAVEHRLLPHAVELIAAGRVSIDPENPRLVRIEGA
ncbi:MAG: phosphoribosylglycinamide formyltransferase [Solirubrobacterales bacterium]|nr:phosphoribosylglycinamide formyltransferase [Solirubrobacterales bacterium]MCO5327055.1 phosphoribosylglycinamide formyltransferase [Solirubrobacterales bacterium]